MKSGPFTGSKVQKGDDRAMFDRELTQEQKSRAALLDNRAWLNNNFAKIQKEYADAWVAILDGKIKAHDLDVEVVKNAVRERSTEAVIIRIPSTAVQAPI